MRLLVRKHPHHTYGLQVNKSVYFPFDLVHLDIWDPSRVDQLWVF